MSKQKLSKRQKKRKLLEAITGRTFEINWPRYKSVDNRDIIEHEHDFRAGSKGRKGKIKYRRDCL